MTAAEALHLAAELEVAADGIVIEDAEAVDNRDGAAAHLDYSVGGEFHVGLVAHREDDRVGVFQGRGDVLLDAQLGQAFLIAEESRPRVAGGGVALLFFQLPPVLDVGVVDADLRAHLSELADDGLRAAVAGVAHVLAVGGAKDDDLRGGDDLAHVAQRVADKLGHVERTRVVDVDGKRRHFEDVVLEAHQVVVRPDAQTAVLREAVAADSGAGEDHVRVGRADLDRLDHLDQIDTVALGKEAPFIEEGEDGCPVGVFDDLAGLAFDGTVEDGEREFLDVQDFREEFADALAGGVVDAAADAPEIADGRNVISAGHDALVRVRKERLRGDAAALEGLLHDRVGDVFGGSRRDGGLDEDKALRRDSLGDDLQALFEGGYLGMARAAVAQFFLEVVALDIDDNAVGKGQGVVGVGCGEGFLLVDATGDERGDLGVFRLDRGDALVQVGDFPERARGWALHPDDEFVGGAEGDIRFPIKDFGNDRGLEVGHDRGFRVGNDRGLLDGIGDDAGHDRPDKADAHDHDNLAAFLPVLCRQFLEALEFLRVVVRAGKRKRLAAGCVGIACAVFVYGFLSAGCFRGFCSHKVI